MSIRRDDWGPGRHPARVGGRYRLRNSVGSGGLAHVYAAWDERLQRRVAVKLFEAVDHPADRRRFDDEVALLASLDHPSLVQLFDAGTDGDHPWAVMPLFTGGTLDVPVRPLSRPMLLLAVADVAAALAYIHARGVIHRDVKPSNVLLDDKGRAYLADFGVARMLQSTGITRTGTMIGTPAYLSPEQVSGAEVTPLADVYSLGLVLLEGITGAREYPGSSAESAVARLSRPPRVPGNVDQSLADLLRQMTATRHQDRPSAEQTARHLWDLAGPQTPPGASRLLGPQIAPRRRARVAALAAAAVVGACLVGGVVTVVGSGSLPIGGTGAAAPPASRTARSPAALSGGPGPTVPPPAGAASTSAGPGSGRSLAGGAGGSVIRESATGPVPPAVLSVSVRPSLPATSGGTTATTSQPAQTTTTASATSKHGQKTKTTTKTKGPKSRTATPGG